MRITLIFALLLFIVACGTPVDPALLQPASFQYSDSIKTSCASDEKMGAAGSTDENQTATGASYNLRTPANYNANVAHPLIVVFAPAGMNANRSERLVHLTKEATEAGYIIAYANNIRLSLKAIERLSAIPQDVANKWCINSSRIYYTGHSDGGTISNALAFLPSSTAKPTAIAPSAAGIDGEGLKQYDCPAPLPVMVLHNVDDSHFEGFGKQAADWWANCNQCSSELSEKDSNGCQVYKNCTAESAKTYFCESVGGHAKWPNKNHLLIDFFNQQ